LKFDKQKVQIIKI